MLPPEVLTQIFQEIRGPRPSGPYVNISMNVQGEAQYAGGDDSGLPTLVQVSLTCKAFNKLSEPLLYQSFHRQWSNQSQRSFVRTIGERPDLGRHILRVSSLVDSHELVFLLNICTRLEQLVLVEQWQSSTTHCSTAYPSSHTLHTSPQADYQGIFSVLQDRTSLQYLCLLDAPGTLWVPPFANLRELRLRFQAAGGLSAWPTLSLTLLPPSLTTLHLHNFASNSETDPDTFRHLEYISLSGRPSPQFIIALLTQTSNLKSLHIGLTWTSNFLFRLPDINLEKERDPLTALEQLTVNFRDFDYEEPSNAQIEAARRFLFDFSQARLVNIRLPLGGFSMKPIVEQNEFLDYVTKVWSSEGTRVVITHG